MPDINTSESTQIESQNANVNPADEIALKSRGNPVIVMSDRFADRIVDLKAAAKSLNLNITPVNLSDLTSGLMANKDQVIKDKVNEMVHGSNTVFFVSGGNSAIISRLMSLINQNSKQISDNGNKVVITSSGITSVASNNNKAVTTNNNQDNKPKGKNMKITISKSEWEGSKTANKAEKVILSKVQWEAIGKKTGWLKKSQEVLDTVEDAIDEHDVEDIGKIDEEIAKEEMEKQRELYEQNKDKTYYVTEYRITRSEEDPNLDRYEVINATKSVGLENAEKLEAYLDNQHADDDNIYVHIEDEGEQGILSKSAE